MKKLRFYQICGIWFFLLLLFNFANGYTVKSTFFHSLSVASLGIFFLIFPVYPERLEEKYSKKQCRIIVRISAGLVILLAFCIKMKF